jgi:hypothetical protein
MVYEQSAHPAPQPFNGVTTSFRLDANGAWGLGLRAWAENRKAISWQFPKPQAQSPKPKAR